MGTCKLLKLVIRTSRPSGRRSGLMVSAFVPGASGRGSSPGRGHCVVFLGKTLHSHGVPLSTQEYKWVPAICWGNLTNCGEVTCDGLASRPGGVEILLAASCYRNRDKLCQYEPVWLIRLHQPARWATWLVCRLYIKMAVVWVFVMLESLSYNIPIYNHPVYNLDYFGRWCNVGCTNGM